MIYRVRAWFGNDKEKSLRLKRYYKVAEEGCIKYNGESSCDAFYDFLLHLLLDHYYDVEVREIDEDDMPEGAIISVL